ncbi:type II secretion protein [Haloprofundus marisrubri]|uniref:Type II secretion protein n=1 Tax=Haloprofundus marisrubri TaxID=1514971 RepID=A0A0W1R7V4_9EURY|nr:type II/IV secretion system ATPase subunit [Haloprofundus marisrubri]KTG09716.1 type II secretion protein [Haloprofundus marisrubri]
MRLLSRIGLGGGDGRESAGGRRSDDGKTQCRCDTSFVEPSGTGVGRRVELVVDADDCPGDGDLVADSACRATVVDALADRDADVVRTRSRGYERSYDGDAAGLLLAAGRFVERAAVHDTVLAERARSDPLGAASDATGRAGPVARIAAETGLAEGAARATGYEDALRAFVGPTLVRSRVALRPPPNTTLTDQWSLDDNTTVRRYDRGGSRDCYHLDPAFADLDSAAIATLAAARTALADGVGGAGERAPGRAVRAVVGKGDSERTAGESAVPVDRLAALLTKHTRGHGVLDDLFADPRVSDVFVTAPVESNPVRVVVDGDRLDTNVRLTPSGAAALASRFRRASGRPFSKADPTLDAVVDADSGRIRVAGVSNPASDGLAFAFRRHDDVPLTLPALVDNDTLSADAAALLSVAVERGAAGLVAGTRGAGKTTLLGALLWELPLATRTVVVEDTPELPVDSLQAHDREVQTLHTDTDEDATLTPTDGVRTALRLGEGALVVGEVRGEEAAALYEAMRVGASGSVVLGTIHGDGGEAVRERVVADLGVPESSFAATDLVVTLSPSDGRHVARIEEVCVGDGDGVRFETLFEYVDGELRSTGVVERGNSVLVDSLAGPNEQYADVRRRMATRRQLLRTLVDSGRTRPRDVAAAYVDR